MTQSGFLVGALLAGFVIWLIMAGKLGAYWALLMGGGTASASSSSATPAAPSSGLNLMDVLPIPGAPLLHLLPGMP